MLGFLYPHYYLFFSKVIFLDCHYLTYAHVINWAICYLKYSFYNGTNSNIQSNLYSDHNNLYNHSAKLSMTFVPE